MYLSIFIIVTVIVNTILNKYNNNFNSIIKGKVIRYEFRKEFTNHSNDYNIIITAEFKINNQIEIINIKTVKLSYPVIVEEITIVLNLINYDDSIEK